MSKSRGNVIDPNDVVEEYGADVLRLYVLFMGDYEKAAPWSQSSIKGCKRFIERVWGLQDIVSDGEGYSEKLKSSFHKTIKKVTEDIEGLKFNTAIAAMMSLINEIYAVGSITKEELRTICILLNPFAPHVTEEMYNVNFGGILNEQSWVEYDESLCKDDTIEIAVQVNGKLRSRLVINVGAEGDEVIEMALADEKVAEAVNGKNVIKQIYVPNKLVNIVAK
jgi:leucyl-tRNA synthetase